MNSTTAKDKLSCADSMTTLSEKNDEESPSPKKLNRQLSSLNRSDFDLVPSGCGTQSLVIERSPDKEDARSVKSDDSPMKKKYLSPTKRRNVVEEHELLDFRIKD